MTKTKIEFRKLPIPSEGVIYNNIYYVVENEKSKVMDIFRNLNENEKDLIKDLITKMATVENFKSPKIKYNLKGYNYGEIRPMPHRFFFFQKYGKNIIFFDYALKKKDSLKNEFYRKLNRNKEKYEEEFKKFIQRY